jgi:O-antigen/teichoic acid export membrane protein
MQPPVNKAHVIARNSFWYALEIIYSVFGALVTSVIVARAIGPVRLSYFNYIVWFTNVSAALSGFGVHTMARKYMAEYLNRDQRSVARAVYLASLRTQAWVSGAMTAAGLALVFTMGEPAYRVIGVLLVLNVAPRTIGFIPSQANNADEKMKRNTGPAVIGGTLTIALTLFSIWIGWDLTGVAAAMLAGPLIETLLKLRSVEQWLGDADASPIPLELKRRMRSFSGESIVLMIVNIIVWDRSDMFFLNRLNKDPRQLTFFSMAFNLSERLLMLPNAFSASVGATMMAQYGRGKEQLRRLTITSGRYALLTSVPLLAGMACVSLPVTRIYGEAFRPMAPVLAIVALMAIPKALLAAPTSLLQAAERQRSLILWGCIGGAVDIALDFLLIPGQGAVGAAIANGVGQAVAVAGVWLSAWRIARLRIRMRDIVPIPAAGAIMAAAVIAVLRVAPGYAGLAVAIPAGAVAWILALRVLRALDADDAARLRAAGRIFPAAFQSYWSRVIAVMVPAGGPA